MFCEKCGNELTGTTCTKCGFIKYFNPIPVAVGVIPVWDSVKQEMFLLGVRRGIIPHIGGISLPGGFMEMETIEAALIRELREETGVNLIDGKDKVAKPFLDKRIIHSTPDKSKLLIFLESQTIYSNDLDLSFKNEETQELVLITRDTPICFPLHKKVIDDFFKNY